VDFVWLILNLLREKGSGRPEAYPTTFNCLSTLYKRFCPCFGREYKGVKVIHTVKNLFCNVALICNLVQEFNGLVSKGLAI
jgi:hypothetical protein